MGTDDLSRAEEELLLRFLDGESGFLESRRARRLIAASQAARDFTARVDDIGSCACSWHGELIRENRCDKLDLWDRVSKRIEDEERASLFHGDRIPQSSANRAGFLPGLGELLDRHLLIGRAAWSLGGAAVAAVLTFFMVAPTPQESYSGDLGAPKITGRSVDLQLGTSERDLVVPASMQHQLEQVYMKRAKRRAMVDGERVYRSQQEFESPFGIEWMKSDGHVTLIQDARRGATIIWVNPPGEERRHVDSDTQAGPPVIINRDNGAIHPNFE